MNYLEKIGYAAKMASRRLARLSSEEKNRALHAIADELEAQKEVILAQNALDLAAGREKKLKPYYLDRLMLNEARIQGLANDTRQVATLIDPVGSAIESRTLPNGLQLTRRRIPIGVLGVIYEARPNVTIDIAVLALKTGNASILRGGSDTLRSNLALIGVIQGALEKAGLPTSAVQYIDNPDRALVGEFMKLDQYVDMLIPRGGHSLHKLCREQATIPVITGGIGICHVFVDRSANVEIALNIIENAKVQRPSVCNALDTVLVHEDIAGDFIPQIAYQLASHGVDLHADPAAYPLLAGNGHGLNVEKAGPQAWDTEWMSLTLGIKVVSGIDEAITHIQDHSLDHSDSIVTENWSNAQKFINEVNSAAVFVNASTRFNDGAQFGLGAEVAISTQKLHARGPMGLEELTTYKWVVLGEGHVRP
ncbi:MAG: glutamate-5-semialdehyde dehydrogenase [Ardenticatenaceae bacterium]|nr:glutamate-5-semialdehyde dehydrogenase [Ardenticatenaceae bacterium]